MNIIAGEKMRDIILTNINPFLHLTTEKFIRSIVRTAFAQCAPAATTKYVRISTFVVCGVSSTILSQPWRQYQIAADAEPTNSVVFFPVKAGIEEENKTISFM